ncbi:MAG: hypothetical protein NE330_22410 [Lentisphaeraceae bacterium]|nr:hypothetical protein [Lentisphaeraceae bacterium]
MGWVKGELQSSTALTKVFRCQAEDGTQAVQKQVEMSPALTVQAFHESFQEACELQKDLASQSEYWCNLHEFSIGESCTYYAESYEGSIKDLISRRVRVTPLELYTLAKHALKGLKELRESKNRPHGNLKSSNVLVSEDRYVLTDPLPASQLSTQESLASDLVYLGSMLVQLITHKNHVDKNDLDDPGWSKLGRLGNDWRAFCTDLLSYDEGAREVDHQQLLVQLESIKPDTRPFIAKHKLPISIASLLVVCLTVYMLFFYVKLNPWPKAEWDSAATAYKPWLGSYIELPKEKWEELSSYGDVFPKVHEHLKGPHWFWFKRVMAANGNDREFILYPLKVDEDIHTNENVEYLIEINADLEAITKSLKSWGFPRNDFSKLLKQIRKDYPLTVATLPTLPASVEEIEKLVDEFNRMKAWNELQTELQAKYTSIEEELSNLGKDIEGLKHKLADLEASGESDQTLVFRYKQKENEVKRFKRRFDEYKADFEYTKKNVNARYDDAQKPTKINNLLAKLTSINNTDLKEIREYLASADFEDPVLNKLWNNYKNNGPLKGFASVENKAGLLFAAQNFHSILDEIEFSTRIVEIPSLPKDDKNFKKILDAFNTKRVDVLAQVVSSLSGVNSATKEADIPKNYHKLLETFANEKKQVETFIKDMLFVQKELARQGFYVDGIPKGKDHQNLKNIYERWQSNELVEKFSGPNWALLKKFADLEVSSSVELFEKLANEDYFPLVLSTVRRWSLFASLESMSDDESSFMMALKKLKETGAQTETETDAEVETGAQTETDAEVETDAEKYSLYIEKIDALVASRKVTEATLVDVDRVAALTKLVESDLKTQSFLDTEKVYLELSQKAQQKYQQFLSKEKQTLNFHLSSPIAWQPTEYEEETKKYFQYINTLTSPWFKIEKYMKLASLVEDKQIDPIWSRYRQKNFSKLTKSVVDADKTLYRSKIKQTDNMILQLKSVESSFIGQDQALVSISGKFEDKALSKSVGTLLTEEKQSFLKIVEEKLNAKPLDLIDVLPYEDSAKKLFELVQLISETQFHLSQSYGSSEKWANGSSIYKASLVLASSRATVDRLVSSLIREIDLLAAAEKSCLTDFDTKDYSVKLFPALLVALSSQEKLNHLKKTPRRLLEKSNEFVLGAGKLGLLPARQEVLLARINTALPRCWQIMYRSVGKGEESLIEDLIKVRNEYKVNEFTSDSFSFNLKLMELKKQFLNSSSVASADEAELLKNQNLLKSHFNKNLRAQNSELFKKIMQIDPNKSAGADLTELNKVGPGKAGFVLVEGKSNEERIT